MLAVVDHRAVATNGHVAGLAEVSDVDVDVLVAVDCLLEESLGVFCDRSKAFDTVVLQGLHVGVGVFAGFAQEVVAIDTFGNSYVRPGTARTPQPALCTHPSSDVLVDLVCIDIRCGELNGSLQNLGLDTTFWAFEISVFVDRLACALKAGFAEGMEAC